MTQRFQLDYTSKNGLGGCSQLFLAPKSWHPQIWEGFTRTTETIETLQNGFTVDWPEIHADNIRHKAQVEISEQGLSLSHEITFQAKDIYRHTLQVLNTYAYQTPLLALIRPRNIEGCALMLVGARAFPLLLTHDYATGTKSSKGGHFFRLTGVSLHPPVLYSEA